MSVGRNTVYNLAGTVTPLVLALVTIPLYLQQVGVERYGALAIIWVILGYFGLFDLGLGRATAHRIAVLVDDEPGKRADVFATAAVVNIGMGIFGGVLLYVAASYFFSVHFEADQWLREEVLDAVPVLALAVPVATLTGVASGALQGREKFLDVNIATVISTSLFQLIPLATAFIIGPTLKWLVVSAIIARVIGFGIFLLRVRTHLLRGFTPRFDNAEWLGLLKYGGWVTLTTLAGPLIVVGDRLVLGTTLGAAAVAIYAVAFDISRRVALIPKAVGNAVFPRIASSEGEARKDILRKSLSVLEILMTVMIIGIICIAEIFLKLWVGQDIGEQATIPARILMFAYWINAFGVIAFIYLQAEGKPDIVTKITIIQLPFYFVLLYYLVEAFGAIGAASAVLLRLIFDVMFLLFAIDRKMPLPRSFFLNFVMILALVVALSRYEFGVLATLSLWLAATVIALALSWGHADGDTRAMIVATLKTLTSKVRLVSRR
ncbi:MAG: flippase [Pseudomonadota bacterium]